MASNFPTSADTFPAAATLAANNLSTNPHSTLHGNLGDALNAVETYLLTGSVTFAAAARSSGVVPYFIIVTPADTAQTASTEAVGIQFGGNASKSTVIRQHATGALATQREYLFVAPTYSAVGASTITDAVTVEVASPIAGTNATLTNSTAIKAIASAVAHVPIVAQSPTFVGSGFPVVTLQRWQNVSGTAIMRIEHRNAVTDANGNPMGKLVLSYAGTDVVTLNTCDSDAYANGSSIRVYSSGTTQTAFLGHTPGYGCCVGGASAGITFVGASLVPNVGGAGAPTDNTVSLGHTTYGRWSYVYAGQGLFYSGATGTTPGIFKGFAGRTVPLVQLQTSVGDVLGNCGGAAFTDIADGATTQTNGNFDDLYTHTLPANFFGINGVTCRGRIGISLVGSATATRQIKLVFAGTTIFDTTALINASAAKAILEYSLIRVSSTIVRYMVSIIAPGLASVVPPAVDELTGLTLSGTNILKLTAAAAGTGAVSGDITAKLQWGDYGEGV